MPPTDYGLRFNQCVVTLATVFLWMAGFLLAMTQNPPMTGVYPSVWVFLTSILLLFGLLIRFKITLPVALSRKNPATNWLKLSFLLALLFWLAEHFLSGLLFPNSSADDLNTWQQSISNYYLWSVFLSSVLLAPVFEEMYFRGLLLNTLMIKLPVWIAVTLSALLFTVIHWNWPDFISLFFIGVIYGWLTIKSNSIIPAVVAHVIHNALTFGIYVSS